MIRILRATDFQGVEVANLKLAPVTVLAGPNGSGKTSLAESIEFAFLGESPRGGTVDDVRRAGQDAAEVEITLDDDARTTLTRRVTGTTHGRKIAEEKALVSARAKLERSRFEAAVEKAKLEVKDANIVAVALGKDGVRAGLIAKGVAPFLDAAGEALKLFAPGWEVEIDPDEFGIRLRQGEAVFRPEQLSDGHRTRLLYVLQVAVARLARVGLVVFDRAELLDATGCGNS